MRADAEISRELRAMLDAIDVPPVRYDAIYRKIQDVRLPPVFPWRHAALVTAAALAIAMLAFPAKTLGLVESVVVKGEQALYRAIGWTPPPRPPSALYSAVRAQNATLKAAQEQVRFTIVPPVDVPHDAALTAVRLATVLVYSNVTHAWSKDAPAVWFLYRRSNGQTFELTADVYDPRTGAPGRYMFEGIDLPGGRTKLIKHDHFEWRNGDQVMSATAGEGITAAEILAIRSAMHGIPLPSVLPGQRDGATIVKQYRLP